MEYSNGRMTDRATPNSAVCDTTDSTERRTTVIDPVTKLLIGIACTRGSAYIE